MANIKNRVGDYKLNNQGMGMTIIAYRTSKDIDVQFDNGTIVEHKQYKSFSSGQLGTSKNRVGEQAINNSGIAMTIIEYRSCNDIDVQFEDGTIRRNVSYDRFKKGTIKYSISKVGEQAIAPNGLQMKIIAYRKYRDIDIEFENGVIVKHKSYNNFKSGYIKDIKHTNRIGQLNKNSEGLMMEIIEYKSSYDVTVKFEDGTIRKHVAYNNFRSGKVSTSSRVREQIRKDRIGETSISNKGLRMKIIDYRTNTDMDVQFEDGYIAYGVTYDNFLKGKIANRTSLNARINEVKRLCGLECKIKVYRSSTDIDLQFEDGTVLEHRAYDTFKRCSIAHPKYINIKEAYIFNNEKFYLCKCRKCKGKHVLRLSEMKDFDCTIRG